MPRDGPTGRLTQDTVRLDLTGVVSADYLYWVMRTPQYRAYCRAHATGTTNLGLPRDDFFAFRFPAPSEETRNLVALLGALDDKTESNRRAAALELDLAITLLSRGTETVRVGDVAELSKGLSYKGSGLDDGTSPHARPMLNLANFTTSGALKVDGLKYYTGDFKSKHRLAAWDLVVANTDLTQSRELLGRGFLVPPILAGALHTHHTSVVRFRERPELALVLWARLQTAEFRDRAKGFATGTTVTALPVEALLDYQFAAPAVGDPSLEAARQLITHSWQLGSESTALAATRDTLLPELLSGRIRVPEAASVVQDGIQESEGV